MAKNGGGRTASSSWLKRFSSEHGSIPRSTALEYEFGDLKLDFLTNPFSEAEDSRKQLFESSRQEQNLEFSKAEASRDAIEERRTNEFTITRPDQSSVRGFPYYPDHPIHGS